MVPQQFIEVLEYLEQLKEDPDATKRFREKANVVITILTNEPELAADKALLVLEELNSGDLASYHRTQVWDVISMLESSKPFQ
jgi:uncharacterized protein (UPF0147 family)